MIKMLFSLSRSLSLFLSAYKLDEDEVDDLKDICSVFGDTGANKINDGDSSRMSESALLFDPSRYII